MFSKDYCIVTKKKRIFSQTLSSPLRTNSDSALHTSALSTKPQDPYGGGGQSAWPATYMGKTHGPARSGPASACPVASCLARALPARGLQRRGTGTVCVLRG